MSRFLIYAYRYAGDHPYAGDVCYVGVTERTLAQRHRSHLCNNLAVDEFLRTFPDHISDIQHIATAFDGQGMLDTEEALTDFYDCWAPRGFNYRAGGKFSAEIIEKLREAAMNNQHFKGKKHRPEAIEKMREAGRRRKHRPETIEKLREAARRRKRRKHRPEVIEKIREAGRSAETPPGNH